MNKGGKIGLVVVLFVLLGVGGYYGYKMLYKPKEDEDEDEIIIPPTNSGDGGGGGSGSGATNYTFPFKTTDEGNTFRAWINTNYPAYAKEIKLDPTGSLNKYVETAWIKYGTEYTTKKGTNVGVKTPTLASNNDIAQIMSFADKSNITTESYLKGSNQNFVKDWAKNIRNSKTAFIWANQVYRTKTGKKVLDYNPTSVILYANKSGDNLVATPSKSASRSAVVKNENLGKGSAVTFADGYLYIKLPSKEQWIASIWISRYKVNFTGETDFENFRGFTNDND